MPAYPTKGGIMRRFAVVASLAVFTACSTAPGPQPVNQAPPSQQVPATSGGGGGGPAHPPGSAEAKADAPTAPNDDKVAELRAAYEKSPGDAALKQKLADATFEDAQYYMYAPTLPPREKYPKALSLYRETVKLDPSNDTARQAIATIEGIYKSMGRPIPEG
jgi:hypothetical protein